MDSQIYKLIANAEQEKNINYLKDAFGILDPESKKTKNDKAKSDVENISQNLYVQCAEAAINLNALDIAKKCIQIYFNLPMISNQFLARAYLCQFQLLVPTGTEQLENLDKCIPFLYKAIEFSKQNKRYNFLIYNASILYFKYIRAFLKPRFRRYACSSLHVIVNSLNEIDDADYEWRATLTKILIECYIDDNNREKANKLSKDAENFIRNYVPNMYNEFFAFAVKEDLLDETELNRLASSKAHLNAIYKIEKLKARIANNNTSKEEFDHFTEINEVYKFILPQKVSESSKTSLKSVKSDGFDNEFLRQKLLLELAHVSLLFDEPNICSLIFGYLKEREPLNEELSLELEFIECEQTVKELRHKQEKYNKVGVKIRTDSIRRCDELLKHAIRLNNSNLVQFGCSIQWNLCLPLLQPGLRKEVRKALQYVAECLETIESMELLLRCQIHYEVSKCEEEIEQLQTAEQHLLKALKLDDNKVYTDQLNHALLRLRLRAELYKTPEKIEDQVAMILEQSVQVDKKNNSHNNRDINVRSLLLRAADLLAHNEFGHVMESETFKQTIGKMNEDMVSRLLSKARNHINCVSKCNSHIADHVQDLENENQDRPKDDVEIILRNDYKQRLKLWFDLCRIARKQQIWDVCRVACRFCLLYDDEKLINRFIPLNDEKTVLFNKELLRNLAEVHFIIGEALIQYIRGESIELFDKPKPPKPPVNSNETSTFNIKFQKQRDFETDTEWHEYCEWSQALCEETIKHFLRGIKIGVSLNESWIVCQGAAYCWNYLHHIFEQHRHSQVNHILTEVLDAIKKVTHGGEAQLLVDICNALAIGLTNPWLPPEQVKVKTIPGAPTPESHAGGSKSPTRKQPKAAAVSQQSVPSKQFSLSADATTDLKKALDVCEYAMQITNGDNLADIVHLKERLPLIKTWVLVKQMLQSPIKNFGLQNTTNPRIQDKYTKCLVAVEILDRNSNGPFEIKEPPTIRETLQFVDQASAWPDKLIELQLWCRLAILANKSNDTESLRYAHVKSLESVSYFEKRKSENKQIYLTSQCMLSEVCIALGEHLAATLNPGSTGAIVAQTSTANKRDNISTASTTSKDVRNTLRREAVNAFSDGAGYAARAENYDLAIHAARQYWNLSLSYLKKSSERALLFENLREILRSLATTYKLNKKLQNEDNKNDDEEEVPEKPVGILKNANDSKKSSQKQRDESPTKNSTNFLTMDTLGIPATVAITAKTQDAFDDLTLRSALYGCLFQILIDKKEYDEALQEMDTALNEMPRTKHRLLIYRYRIMTKAKLGLDVQMDLQKFREESEKNLAQMYRKVALSSSKHEDIIAAYQRAIEALNAEENLWQKFEYLLELAQWLYSNEYNLQNCIDLVEWAIDIICNIRLEKPQSSATSAASRASRQTKKSIGKQVSQPTAITTINETNSLKTQPNAIISMSDIIETKSEIGTDIDAIISTSKEAVIGTLPINKNLQITNLQDVRQLECLIRANIVIARIIGKSSVEYTHFLIKSYAFLIRLLHQSIDNAFYSIKEIQKLNAAQAEAAAGANNKKQDAKAQTKNREASASAKVGGLQQKKIKFEAGSNGYLPQNVDEWSSFEINDEITNAWTHDLMKKTGININTIQEPLLFYYYLDMLAEMINEQGFTHFLFPIYNLQLIIIKTAFKQQLAFTQRQPTSTSQQFTSLECYTRLKCINLCVELNLINSVGLHQQAIVNLILNANASQAATGAPAAKEQANASTIPSTNNSGSNPSQLLKLIQLDPFEVSYVRDEVYENNQRKAQIAKEELSSASSFLSKKSKELLVPQKVAKRQTFAGIENKNDEKKIQLKMKQKIEELQIPGEHKVISNSLIEILYKDVWIKIADLLVQNGYMQNARDFIYEALHTSQNYEDNHTTAKLYYLLGELSLFDSKFSEAINYSIYAQKVAIDETFWYKCVNLLIKASKADVNNRNSLEKTGAILNKALDIVEKEIQKRPNKASQFLYMKAMFVYELAKLNCDKIINKRIDTKDKTSATHIFIDHVNTMRPTIFKQLSQACKMYSVSVEILMSQGYKRETLPILKSHADLLKRFAVDCHNLEAKHDYMLQSYLVLSQACKIASELWYDTQTYQTYNELQNCSLPIQRELINTKLNLSQLLTEILDTHINELKATNKKNLEKDRVVKAFEDYMKDIETLSDTEQEWKSLLSKISNEIFSNLISVYNLSQKLKQFKAKTFYLIGRTIRLTNALKMQQKADCIKDNSNVATVILPLSKWDEKILDLIKQEYAFLNQSIGETDNKSKANKTLLANKVNQPTIETEQTPLIDQSTDQNTNEQLTQNEQFEEPSELSVAPSIEKLKEQELINNLISTVNQYDSQAMEILLQTLNIAFSIEDQELIANTAYELIQLTGRFDMQLCSQFIALYQSSMNSIEIKEFLEKCLKDPKNSLLASYLHQMNTFKETSIKTNCLNSPTIIQYTNSLKSKFNALKNLSVNSNHFNLSKDFPNNYILLILQHNSQKNELYGTIMDRLKTNINPKPTKAQSSFAAMPPTKAMAIKIETDENEFHELQHQWRLWKYDLQTLNLKIEFHLNHEIIRRQMLANLNASSTAGAEEQYFNSNASKSFELIQAEKELEDRFNLLLQKTEEYLRPITDYFQSYFTNLSHESAAPNKTTTEKQNDRVIILADLSLLEFPLEALKLFHDNTSISSISRDFSLQFLYNRYFSDKENPDAANADDKNKKAKAPPVKQATVAGGTSDPVPEGSLIVDPVQFKYLVDIYGEASNTVASEHHPVNAFKSISQQFNPIVSKWQGISGNSVITSLGERERMLTESNGLLFYGTERFLSYLQAPKIPAFNLNKCNLLFINDLSQTTKSSNRISKLDVFKSYSEIQFEQPLQSSILMSLAGIKSIACNQWSTTLIENSNKFQSLFKDLLTSPQAIGEIIRYRISPHIKQMLINKAKKEEESQKKQAQNLDAKDAAKKDAKKDAKDKAKSPMRTDKKSLPATADSLQIDEKQQQQKDELELNELKELQNLAIITKEKCNMVCYGVPDVYLVN